MRNAHRVATTVGFGPRFLHSTGQLHKGGPDTCVVLQITADDPDDPMIPGMNVGFRTLLAAQALGDWMSLDKRNRRGVRVHLKGAVEPALRALDRRRRRSALGTSVKPAPERKANMQLGMVGLGKMGNYMTQRLIGGGHQVVAYDRDPKAVAAAVAAGATGASSSRTWPRS